MLPAMLAVDMLPAGLPGGKALKGDGDGAAGPCEDGLRAKVGMCAAIGVDEGEAATGEPAVLIIEGTCRGTGGCW